MSTALASVGTLGAHPASQAAPPALPPYATLYATCAALMIAVLVVFYFDQRVRDRLTARQRGYAVGSLGGVIGTGLLVCLFVLAGIIPDKTTIRVFITIYTLAFLAITFSTAISAWGREDAARLQQARTPPVSVPPVPIPRGAATERERAAELAAAALFILGQTHPAAVMQGLERNGPAHEKERLRLLTDQWMTLQPELLAIGAWYPTAEGREASDQFVLAGHQALKETAILFDGQQTVTNEESRTEWRERTERAYEALTAAWDALTTALNPPGKQEPPGRITERARRPESGGSQGKPAHARPKSDTIGH
jgi:hypothetical protein